MTEQLCLNLLVAPAWLAPSFGMARRKLVVYKCEGAYSLESAVCAIE
jgi:hypothetical protein